MARKKLPDCLRALGRDELPDRIELDSTTYTRVRTFKHDFFAATGLYEGAGRKVIVKLGRRGGFLGLPLGWAGRLLSVHEADLLNRLADLDGVPELIGIYQGTGVVRAHIPGDELQPGNPVNDEFFERLARMIDTIHQRQMAYVDLEKRHNVLVGDDGRPYLIDFQISWPWPVGWLGRTGPGRWLCRQFQKGDLYHLAKLRRRFRPDQMTTAELAASYRRPWPVRIHRRLTRPLTRFRRWVLAKVDPKRRDTERGRCG